MTARPSFAGSGAARQWLPHALALGVLALLALVFFWPVTLQQGWIPRGGGDLVSFIWPTYSYAARALQAGRLPLWNESLYSGAPFAADNQSGLFYPINLIVFLLWPALPYAAVEWLVVGHVWLAGAGMYALVWLLLSTTPSRLGRFTGALLAGAAYMFSDIFVTHVGNLNIVAVSAWLPIAFAALHVGLARRSAGWAAAAGAALAMAALAGHAQMTLIIASALGLYGGWHAAASFMASSEHGLSRLKSALPPLGITALMVMVALGISAVAILPAAELAQYTGRARLEYDTASEYSLPWAGLAGLFSPLVFGRNAVTTWAPWPRVALGYAGALTLLLAALAPFRQRRRETLFLLGLGLFGVLAALGQNAPLHRLLYDFVPGFAQLRVPARFILLTDFSLAALGGLGAAQLGQLPVRRLVMTAAGLLLVGAMVIAIAFQSAPGSADHRGSLISGLAVFGALVAGGLAMALAASRRAALLGLAALIGLDLIGQGAWVEVEPNDPTLGYQRPAVQAYLQASPGPVRIDNVAAAWPPDAAARLGLEDVAGISNPLQLAAYQTYFGAVGPRGSPLYNFLNVRFVLADKGQPPGDSSFVPVFDEDSALDVYLNTNAQPRIHLIYTAHTVASGEAAFGAIHAPSFDPQGAVVLDSSSAQPAPPALDGEGVDAAGERNLFYTAYSPEDFAVVAVTPAPAYLVFAEVWYPGWRAWVDGVEAPIYRANFAFRAVFLATPGEHTVIMRFQPATFQWGMAITLLTFLGLLGWAGWAAHRRRV